MAFADRLNLLFERARSQGHPLSNQDVERLTHGALSANHIWRLRNGYNQNPSLETIQLLADLFGVSLDFFRGHDDVSEDDAVRRALAQPELRSMVARLGLIHGVMHPRDVARLAQIIDLFVRDIDDDRRSSDTDPDVSGSPPA